MFTKRITVPMPVEMVAPDSWTMAFDGETLVYTEHFADVSPELLPRTLEVTRALSGSGVQVYPVDDGIRLVHSDVHSAFKGMVSELVVQMVVRDLMPEAIMHQILALLNPQLAVPGIPPRGQVVGHREGNPHRGIYYGLPNEPTSLELES